uniref:Protein kinase domain-containing protein n=1 Tax=Sander lucioperca TaxID=283035 RepID=A0A8C9ZWM2_SANLU
MIFTHLLEMAPTIPLYNKTNFQIEEQEVLPTTSGGYLVETFLGEGRFGKVARCLKLKTNEKMALKIVRTDAGTTGKREVAMLRRLRKLDEDKNNLVRMTEYFRHKGHYCLVFEMLDTSLHDLMKERNSKPLCLSGIRVISQQMLVALNALKSIGLLHTDIKPDNVMLVNHKLQPFRVKLIDFGLAATVSTMFLGTIQALGYRAPEVILGLPLDEAVDMWSLGCVLAFLKNKEFSVPKWRLNTQKEYKLKTDSMTKCRNVKQATEYDDTLAFLSLLKRMLHVDCKKRISPSEALGHRFITMRHLPRHTHDRSYVTALSLILSTDIQVGSV